MADQPQAQQQFSHAPVKIEASEKAQQVFKAIQDDTHKLVTASVTPMPMGNILAPFIIQIIQAVGPALIQKAIEYLQNQGQGAAVSATQSQAPAK